MNFQEIEKLRKELLTTLPNIFGQTKLFRISNFYYAILATNDKNIIEAYSLDFIIEYIVELKLYTPFYQLPEKTVSLLNQLEKLKTVSTLSQFESEFDEIRVSIIQRLDLLNYILEGQTSKSTTKCLRFPVIESSINTANKHSFGSLQSVNIKIHKAKSNNHFVFVPTGNKIEERLLQQAKISLEIALNYLSKYKHKFHKYHEVLIYFENLNANYEGNSLGVALTIGFIEQLSLLYNLPYITYLMNNLATTGGVTESGEIIPVGKEIIASKTEAIFFSDIDTFVVPNEDEKTAFSILTKLFEQYPCRKLSIVPIGSIKAFINRRDLVDIKKQPRIIRTARSIKRNVLSSILFLLLTLILIFVYIRDFDDNPASFDVSGQAVLIKNKSGKTLWMKALHIDHKMLPSETYEKAQYRIIDVENDGANEVILTNEIFSDNDDITQRNRVACFNKDGSLRWKYFFKDSVRSEREYLDDDYGPSYIVGTKLSGNMQVIYLSSRNGKSYSSAIYLLDLKTGKRVGSTLWNSGHIIDGTLYDLDGDKKEELIYTFCNNGLHKAGIAIIKLDFASGQGPSAKDYMFLNIKTAYFSNYILTPRTDYNVYIQERNNGIVPFSLLLNKREQVISFATSETADYPGHGLCYRLNFDLRKISVFAMDEFTGKRDALVKELKLKQPFTDTKEYYNLIQSQILFWDGKDFVKSTDVK